MSEHSIWVSFLSFVFLGHLILNYDAKKENLIWKSILFGFLAGVYALAGKSLEEHKWQQNCIKEGVGKMVEGKFEFIKPEPLKLTGTKILPGQIYKYQETLASLTNRIEYLEGQIKDARFPFTTLRSAIDREVLRITKLEHKIADLHDPSKSIITPGPYYGDHYSFGTTPFVIMDEKPLEYENGEWK